MVESIETQAGQRPEEVLADSGYCSEKNLEYLESAGQPEKKIAATWPRAGSSMGSA